MNDLYKYDYHIIRLQLIIISSLNSVVLAYPSKSTLTSLCSEISNPHV